MHTLAQKQRFIHSIKITVLSLVFNYDINDDLCNPERPYHFKHPPRLKCNLPERPISQFHFFCLNIPVILKQDHSFSLEFNVICTERDVLKVEKTMCDREHRTVLEYEPLFASFTLIFVFNLLKQYMAEFLST